MAANQPHVIIVSPGAKVGLTESLADAVGRRGGRLTAWEADRWSPASTRCASRATGGPIEDDTAARNLLDWCANNNVRLVVPTRHGDLRLLSEWRRQFVSAGIEIAISTPECIHLCLDKAASHTWLAARGYPVPLQATVQEYATSELHDRFPLIAKDPTGSGSREIRVVQSASMLSTLPAHWLLQDIAPGIEYTVNTYVSRNGQCLCEIPHERMMVSEGEVIRARTARIPELAVLTRALVESLPGASGPLNVQLFWESGTRRATVIEVNPRFGGGYPLAHRSGGHFVDWLLAEYLDGETPPRVIDWEDQLLMVRYREAIFVPNAPPA